MYMCTCMYMYMYICEAHGIYMEGMCVMCVLAVEHVYICAHVEHMVSICRVCVY